MLIIVTRGGIVECGCWDAYRSKIAPGAPVDPPTDELGIEVHLSLSEAEKIGLVPSWGELDQLRKELDDERDDELRQQSVDLLTERNMELRTEVEQLRAVVRTDHDQYELHHPYAHNLRRLYPWLAAEVEAMDAKEKTRPAREPEPEAQTTTGFERTRTATPADTNNQTRKVGE